MPHTDHERDIEVEAVIAHLRQLRWHAIRHRHVPYMYHLTSDDWNVLRTTWAWPYAKMSEANVIFGIPFKVNPVARQTTLDSRHERGR